MKFFLIGTIVASLLGGCSWVQGIRGIPPPVPEAKAQPPEAKEAIKTPQHVPVDVVPNNQGTKKNYADQRKSEIFSLKAPKQKTRAIEGTNDVERAALKEAYDDMDVNLEKNRSKAFSL